MNEVKKESYAIDFKGLDVGEHHFEFEINDTLFERYEGCEILSGSCKVEIDMERSESMLVLEVDIIGTVQVECDRCLEPCDVDIDCGDSLIVKFTDDEELSSMEYDGEVMWLPSATSTLDLAQYLYESVVLDLPYQRVHDEGECDPEMIKKFKIISGEEFEEMERESEEAESETMPQSELAKLAALKAKLEK